MANLTVTITEAVTLNGSSRGSTNTLTIADIDDVYHRIVTLADDMADATLVAFTDVITGRDGAINRDHVKYIRITNLDASNPVILSLQQQEAEHATNVGDQNLGILLSAGKSFIMGEAANCIDVEAGTSAISRTIDLHDLESIMVDPLSEAVRVEIFIASLVE